MYYRIDFQENVQGRDDIDFRATLQEFVRHHLQVAIRFVMNDSCNISLILHQKKISSTSFFINYVI